MAGLSTLHFVWGTLILLQELYRISVSPLDGNIRTILYSYYCLKVAYVSVPESAKTPERRLYAKYLDEIFPAPPLTWLSLSLEIITL